MTVMMRTMFLFEQEGAKQSKEGRPPPLWVTKVKESKGSEGELNPGKIWCVCCRNVETESLCLSYFKHLRSLNYVFILDVKKNSNSSEPHR